MSNADSATPVPADEPALLLWGPEIREDDCPLPEGLADLSERTSFTRGLLTRPGARVLEQAPPNLRSLIGGPTGVTFEVAKLSPSRVGETSSTLGWETMKKRKRQE